MVQERQQLYIIGGQRDRQPLGDMIAYDIASNMVRNVPGSNDGRSKCLAMSDADAV